MVSTLSSHLDILRLKHFDIRTLHVDSQALKGNPLGDPSLRSHPVLVPKDANPKAAYPVVFLLSGFAGNGPNYFNQKTFESNFVQTLDRSIELGEAPHAIFVLIDAMTSWGGSQFLNSEGTGRYEDLVAVDTFNAVREQLPVAKDARQWCVMGGSSGGYGAFHLSSKYPEKFGLCAAIAPDSFFEASLLPDVWATFAHLKKLGGIEGVRAELMNGKLMKKKEAFQMLNAIAMGLCYAPKSGGVDWPIDEETGRVRKDVFAKWLAHDPIVFLQDRIENVGKLAGIWLDVGVKDQFNLQYGTRQIREILIQNKIAHEYSEFDGTHFDLDQRRPLVWKWLAQKWSAS